MNLKLTGFDLQPGNIHRKVYFKISVKSRYGFCIDIGNHFYLVAKNRACTINVSESTLEIVADSGYTLCRQCRIHGIDDLTATW